MNIYVAWHLGLGDAIACSAIIAKLAQNNFVNIPCWKHNEVSVKSFFVNQPSVIVHCIDNDAVLKTDMPEKFNDKVVRLGYYNTELPQLPDEDFVQWFYRQSGMDISEKEKYCPIKEAAKRVVQSESKMKMWPNSVPNFIHSDRERGFEIKPIHYHMKPYYIASKNGLSILSNAEHIETAREVHCIDSSFIHLAECLNVTGKKFYHKYARPNSTDFKYLKGWEVIE